MKKSTFLIVALVYIVSFIIVGLFGASIKGYDPIIYVESISLTVPQQATAITDKTSSQDEYDYYYAAKYKEGMIITLKAEVKPDNTTYPEVDVSYDETQTVYTVSVVDNVFIYVSFAKKGTATFVVESTDGMKLQTSVKILVI